MTDSSRWLTGQSTGYRARESQGQGELGRSPPDERWRFQI